MFSGTVKHVFRLYSNPAKSVIDNCIECCTADGSEVVKMKVKFNWLGTNLKITIWTKRK